PATKLPVPKKKFLGTGSLQASHRCSAHTVLKNKETNFAHFASNAKCEITMNFRLDVFFIF
ncbi:hypothetical protein, partial [Desulfonatronospira sp.]|uniref:hypothetical protein n=1 Tax=Desulfonatronospira sp. TaxID=1962951 RepID=UPI0025C3F38D